MYIKTKFGAFEWDDAKAEYNFRKHEIRFTDAIRIFENRVYTYPSKGEHYEKREISIGILQGVLVAAVVHTKRGKAKRIISARPADRDERADFAAFIKSRH